MSWLKDITESIDAPATQVATVAPNRHNRRAIQARFDTAFTTDENRRHWALADAMSIDASASPGVRRLLRMRSRYEYHNNSYFMGISNTIVDYTIGPGPRLQMQSDNPSFNAAFEKDFTAWAREVHLARTLRDMRCARIVSGEGLAVMRTNPLLRGPVKLDVHGIECDQLSAPMLGMYAPQYPDQFFDGLELDPWGRPETYHIMRQHPGATGALVTMGYETDPWAARYVLHDFKRIRPGQQRGIPEATPALPLFAYLRRYTLAVLNAAEMVANHAIVLETDEAPGEDDQDYQAMDRLNLDRGTATVLPKGYGLNQVKAEQPTGTYGDFKTEILGEICRCMDVPLFFASLDAQKANMSSAYVVTQPFARSVQVDRSGYEILLDRVVEEFAGEWCRATGVDPATLPPLNHVWRWPRIGHHADPAKTASAQETRLNSGVSCPQLEAAEDGNDYEEIEAMNAKAFGMTVDAYRAARREKYFSVKGNPNPASLAPEPAGAGSGTTATVDPVDDGGEG